MAGRKASGKKVVVAPLEEPVVPDNHDAPRPRLKSLSIKNFRCIGSEPVRVELDDIVVLVGRNNVGKSTILRAYEVAMSEGSDEANLTLEDFPGNKVVEDHLPEIILETIVYVDAGQKWMADDDDGQKVVTERWTWTGPGKPTRQGFNVEMQSWDTNSVPWGAANVANSRRPKPHRVDAFADPSKQANEIIKLLQSAIEARVKNAEEGQVSHYEKLRQEIFKIRALVLEDSKAEVEKVESDVSDLLHEVFPEYSIKFDVNTEAEPDKLNIFGKTFPAKLLMGPKGGHQTDVERQGSGARRTLLWTALKILSDIKPRANTGSTRPNVLLLDEPEICLHPNAIREACRVLYELPTTGTWQVMVTTHSPCFIDFSRNNTTVVCVERDETSIKTTTCYRPKKASLSEDDVKLLKLLNTCDPYVAEFFFGGKTVVVEGDTEYTAFKYVTGIAPETYRDVHIIRARGKATICAVAKILNQFGARYSILHDSDKPTCLARKSKKTMKSPAWGNNRNIREAADAAPDPGKVMVVASVPNFEEAYFGESVEDEKPYAALQKLQGDEAAFKHVADLLDALVSQDASKLPKNALAYQTIDELMAAFNEPEIEPQP